MGGKLDHGIKSLHNGRDGGIGPDDGFGILLDDLLNEGGQILVMIIKGVAVDAAPLYDILDGDIIQGAFLQQGGECLLDGAAGKVGHSSFLLSDARLYYNTDGEKFKNGILDVFRRPDCRRYGIKKAAAPVQK